MILSCIESNYLRQSLREPIPKANSQKEKEFFAAVEGFFPSIENFSSLRRKGQKISLWRRRFLISFVFEKIWNFELQWLALSPTLSFSLLLLLMAFLTLLPGNPKTLFSSLIVILLVFYALFGCQKHTGMRKQRVFLLSSVWTSKQIRISFIICK